MEWFQRVSRARSSFYHLITITIILTTNDMKMNQGYINVDALDEDMPTLRKLEALQLYRWLHLFWSHYLSYKSTIFKNVMFRLQFCTLDFTGLCFHRNYIWRHLEGIGSTGLKEASWTEIHQNLVFKWVRSSNSKEENYVKQYLEQLFKEQNISRLKEEQ